MKFAVYGPTSTTASFEPRTARAFCDGRQAAFNGVPLGSNPFTVERERENNLAWAAGHADQIANPTASGFCAASTLGDPATAVPIWDASIPAYSAPQGAAWTIDMNNYVTSLPQPVTFAISTGAPPSGITSNADGTFSGTVTNAGGAGSITFIATNVNGASQVSPTLDWTIA